MKNNWLRELKRSDCDPKAFLAKSWIDHEVFKKSQQLTEQLQFRCTPIFSDAIDKNITAIKNQFVPSTSELDHHYLEIDDPIGDDSYQTVKGITHRYPDRVLLKPIHHCAVYCRFCFRREKVSHPGYNLNTEEIENAIHYIAENKNIIEVILTGGDPLILTEKKLAFILEKIATIDHIKTVRFHTRIPTVLPSRINDSLIDLLRNYQKPIRIVAHINSHHELQDEAREAISKLLRAGIPLLHQAVLLKGINSDYQELYDLLLEVSILGLTPYYLHYPDLAKGTNHFRIPLSQALELMRKIRGCIPGYMIPRLVVDIPGGGGKVFVEPEMIKSLGENTWEIISPIDGQTQIISYPET